MSICPNDQHRWGPWTAPVPGFVQAGHEVLVHPGIMARRECPDCRTVQEAQPTAPSPAAAGLLAEDVERVARALWETAHARFTSMVATWESTSEWVREHYRALAAAALAEMRPTAAEGAVKRVEALIAFYDRHEYSVLNVDDLRAALAPVSHDADGGERR